jgi:hypothetical protein
MLIFHAALYQLKINVQVIATVQSESWFISSFQTKAESCGRMDQRDDNEVWEHVKFLRGNEK